MQSNIRPSRPQRPHSPGSPKQCQDLSTGQTRAQEHSLAISLSDTLPNPCPEHRDAGSSYCGTLELHRRALLDLGRADWGLLYHICHLLVCFAILCSSWLGSKTPTCSLKALPGLSKQTTGRDESGEGEGRGGEKKGKNQNLIKKTLLLQGLRKLQIHKSLSKCPERLLCQAAYQSHQEGHKAQAHSLLAPSLHLHAATSGNLEQPVKPLTSVSATRSYQSAAPLAAQFRDLLVSFAVMAQQEVGEGWDAGREKPWEDGTRRPPGHIGGSTKFFKNIFSNENCQRTNINQEVDPEGLLLASAHPRAL